MSKFVGNQRFVTWMREKNLKNQRNCWVSEVICKNNLRKRSLATKVIDINNIKFDIDDDYQFFCNDGELISQFNWTVIFARYTYALIFTWKTFIYVKNISNLETP